MLGFRLKEGLDLEVVASNYGQTAVRRVEEGVAEGLMRGWVIRDLNGSNGGGGSSGTNGTSGVGVVDHTVDIFGTRSGADWRDDNSSRHASIEAGSGVEIRTPQGVVSGGSPSGGLGRLRLSDPDGFLFSNSVISSVFCELDGWKRSRREQKGGAATGR